MKAFNPGYRYAGQVDGDSFGFRMAAAREHARLTEKEAAEKIGYSLQQLRRIERGAVIMSAKSKSLVQAADVYGVTAVWLYAGSAAGKKVTPDWYVAPSTQPL